MGVTQPVDQKNNQGNFQHVKTSMKMSYSRSCCSSTMKKNQTETSLCGANSRSASSQATPLRASVTSGSLACPGIICQQIKRASQNYPKHLATSQVTTNIICEVVEDTEMPA